MKSKGTIGCIIDECMKPRHTTKYCYRHYEEAKGVFRPTKTVASNCACGNPHHAKGLCQYCYAKEYRQNRPPSKQPPCACGKPFYGKGLCKACYMKAWHSVERTTEKDEFPYDLFWVWVSQHLGVEGSNKRKVKI